MLPFAKNWTIKYATEYWLREFNAIPKTVIQKLWEADNCCIEEITLPSFGDRVITYDKPEEHGEIIKVTKASGTRQYLIAIDNSDKQITLTEDEFEIHSDSRSDWLPMWGTMWQFNDGVDNGWFEFENQKGITALEALSDCGFRVYKQEDFNYIFGIDGAGYDFYENHWIPLYKARGLHWHDPETEKAT